MPKLLATYLTLTIKILTAKNQNSRFEYGKMEKPQVLMLIAFSSC
jgi:hypothetical protein